MTTVLVNQISPLNKKKNSRFSFLSFLWGGGRASGHRKSINDNEIGEVGIILKK